MADRVGQDIDGDGSHAAATPSPAGWGEALARQAREHGRLFYRLAHSILRDAAAAEDACQQAMLQAWQARLDIGGGPAALKAWLIRTVVNTSLQVLRRRKVERRAIRLHVPDEADVGRADGVDPFLREELMAGLLRLPDVTRSVVMLRVMEGMSGKDVAGLLGCSPGEASRQLHRGLEHLRGILNRDGAASAPVESERERANDV